MFIFSGPGLTLGERRRSGGSGWKLRARRRKVGQEMKLGEVILLEGSWSRRNGRGSESGGAGGGGGGGWRRLSWRSTTREWVPSSVEGQLSGLSSLE